MHPVFHVYRLKKFLHRGDSLIEGIVLFQKIEDKQTNKNPGPRSNASMQSEDTHGVGCMAWITFI